MLGHGVPAVALEGGRKVVLLPGAVEEGNEAVLEDVQEVAQRPVAHPCPLGDELRVVIGQHAERADQPHEVDHHAAGAAPRQLHGVDLARGEGDDGAGGEVHDLRRRVAEATDGSPLGVQALQEPHGLKEPVRGRVEGQLPCDLGAGYTSVFHPALGGHSRSTSLRCRVRAARMQKLFSAV